jgi:hypothetical protein
MAQTALDWFFDKLKNHEIQAEHFELYKQAKEMENEQLLSVYKSGLAGFMEDGIQKITITRIND